MIEPLRFLDVPPRSRNPELANILSKFHITESRGTGIDKVVYSLEEAHLPTVEILSKGTTATQVTIREEKHLVNWLLLKRMNQFTGMLV